MAGHGNLSPLLPELQSDILQRAAEHVVNRQALRLAGYGSELRDPVDGQEHVVAMLRHISGNPGVRLFVDCAADMHGPSLPDPPMSMFGRVPADAAAPRVMFVPTPDNRFLVFYWGRSGEASLMAAAAPLRQAVDLLLHYQCQPRVAHLTTRNRTLIWTRQL